MDSNPSRCCLKPSLYIAICLNRGNKELIKVIWILILFFKKKSKNVDSTFSFCFNL
ncbi:hypothetical protein KFK09_014213 [Dendrobium nobile]|uniref:Uncharacterized protein n=1 Tax=Dendrobium nobile TaxID=94219 RepID=A0A8T3BF15_DENNO|nr:hypothetical protein KFK09_014213 [Dendrobium nobile]